MVSQVDSEVILVRVFFVGIFSKCKPNLKTYWAIWIFWDFLFVCFVFGWFMYSRRISSKFWDVCVKVGGWHQVTSSVTLYIIGTGSFAEPGVDLLCPTGWSSCSRNLPVCSAGIRFIEVRCAVVPSVLRISYTTALYFHHIHPSFPSLTPLRCTLISYPILTSFLLFLKNNPPSSICSTHTYGCGAIL